MSAGGAEIVRLDAAEAHDAIAGLAELLIDAVDSGAGVSFMAPLSLSKAEGFWRGIAADIAADAKVLIAARQDGRVVGSVVLGLRTPENQPHRADVSKLLVHRRARRRGIARALLLALEVEALRRGRNLLVLDTASHLNAAPLYRGLGYIEAGRIPGYALKPHGGLDDTIVFWKQLVP